MIGRRVPSPSGPTVHTYTVSVPNAMSTTSWIELNFEADLVNFAVQNRFIRRSFHVLIVVV